MVGQSKWVKTHDFVVLGPVGVFFNGQKTLGMGRPSTGGAAHDSETLIAHLKSWFWSWE